MTPHEMNKIENISRHRTRRPIRGKDLYVTVSELQLVATGRLEVTCVSTIPEFRSIEDKFADVRNETVIVEVYKETTYEHPENFTSLGSSTSEARRIALDLKLLLFYVTLTTYLNVF